MTNEEYEDEMFKLNIDQYLRDSLKINLEHKYRGDYSDDEANYIKVKLLLNGEQIDASQISLDIPDRCSCAE